MDRERGSTRGHHTCRARECASSGVYWMCRAGRRLCTPSGCFATAGNDCSTKILTVAVITLHSVDCSLYILFPSWSHGWRAPRL